MIPVKDNKGLFRDEKTNSIINCDDTDYVAFRGQDARAKLQSRNANHFRHH